MSAPDTWRRKAALVAGAWPLAALAVGVMLMLAWISFLGWAAYRVTLMILN